MRFILFDRIEELKKGEHAILVKNVSQTEDYFIDHFPGYPDVPGSNILGSFEQGGEILLGASFDFSCRAVLKRLSRVSLRHTVLPGDQLRISLTIDSTNANCIKAVGWVKEKRVADANLEFTLESPDGDPRVQEACERLRAFYQLLTANPVRKVWEVWGTQG